MRNLLLWNIKKSVLNGSVYRGILHLHHCRSFISCTGIVQQKSQTQVFCSDKFRCKKISLFSQSPFVMTNSLLIKDLNGRGNLLYRPLSTNTSEQPKNEKRPSKFKQLYSQYGPSFVVIHLITVVLWIYGFFLISKQGYDITQLLNLFVKLNMMTEETVKSIHYKIDNWKSESTWITGENIKHFATAYMVYKVIAPFRYMVSLAIVRSFVKAMRARGLMK